MKLELARRNLSTTGWSAAQMASENRASMAQDHRTTVALMVVDPSRSDVPASPLLVVGLPPCPGLESQLQATAKKWVGTGSPPGFKQSWGPRTGY